MNKLEQRRGWRIAAAVIVLAAGLAIGFFADLLWQNPFTRAIQWDAPSFAGSSALGTVVIDASKTRVSLLNENGDITTVLRGGSREEQRFFYAENAVIHESGIYLVDVRYTQNGTRVESERVLHYTASGNFAGVVFEQSYSGGAMPLQYGNISYLGASGGELCFLLKESDAIVVYRVTDGQARRVQNIPTAGVPPVWCAAYDIPSGAVWLTTKTGAVYTATGESQGFLPVPLPETVRDSAIVRDIAIADGQVFCTDLGSRSVLNLSNGGTLLAPEPDAQNAPIYYRLYSSGALLSTTDNTEIITINKNGEILAQSTGAAYAPEYRLKLFAAWGAALVLGLAALACACFLLRRLLKSARSKTVKTTFLFAVIIIIATMFTSSGIVRVLFQRLNENTAAQLRQTAAVVSSLSGQTFGDALASIDSLDDYGNADYNALRGYLNPYCDAAYANGSNMYYVVYQLAGGQLYGVADYENTTGVRYPYAQYVGSDYEKVVDGDEIIAVSTENSAYGSFSYVMAPVYNSAGETVGVLELGINQWSENMKNKALIYDIALSTAVILFILLLALTEGTVFAGCVHTRRENPASNAPLFLRPMVFLAFFTSNLCAAFMPMLSANLLADSGASIPQSLGGAFPMSLELFFVAVFAFCGGFLMDRGGLKRMMLAAVGLQLAGHLVTTLAVFTSGYALFLLGRVFTGAGLGILVVAFNAMPNLVAEEEEREGFYAQLNAGLISGVVIGSSIGAYVADWWGYAAVFAAAAIFMLPLAALVFYTVSNTRDGAEAARPESASMPVLQFVLGRRVLSFLVLIMAPFLVIMYFKDYLFPMFAAANGYTDVAIGNILLFSGALSIYFGPSATAWLFRRIGKTGMLVFSSAVFAAAMLAFGFFPTPGVATAVVFIISLVAGFGLTGQSVYFSSMREFFAHGVNRSMSVYSLWDNVSQTVGPILFGALLFLGYGGACLALGGTAAALLLLFVVIGLKGDQKNG